SSPRDAHAAEQFPLASARATPRPDSTTAHRTETHRARARSRAQSPHAAVAHPTTRAVCDRATSRAAESPQPETLLDRKPRALSGGQRQRVAIGRAIVREPDVFLFDEPLSNLDAALRGQMRVEIARLHARLGAT